MVSSFKLFGTFPLLVIIVYSGIIWGCIAAPSTDGKNVSQTEDVLGGTPTNSTRTTSDNTRRRFILRRATTPTTSSTVSTTSSAQSRTRKRHLQTSNINPNIGTYLQRGVSHDGIIPYLEFGQKLNIATTSANSISDLKQSTTLNPTKLSSSPSTFSRLIIDIERPTSPNSILLDNDRTTPSPREIITIITKPQTTPTTTSISPPSTTASLNSFSIVKTSQETPTSTAVNVRVITLRPQSTPLPLISQSDDAFNDIMTNSQRRRRKKLVARRMQLNVTDVITDNIMNDTAMNAAIVRRKSLLQPQRNVTSQQSVLRRPLMRITSSPSAKYTSLINASESPILESSLPSNFNTENKTNILRNLLTSLRPIINNNTSKSVDLIETTSSTNISNINHDKSSNNNHDGEIIITTTPSVYANKDISSNISSSNVNDRKNAVTQNINNETLLSTQDISIVSNINNFRNETSIIPSSTTTAYTNITTQRSESNIVNNDSNNNNRNPTQIIPTNLPNLNLTSVNNNNGDVKLSIDNETNITYFIRNSSQHNSNNGIPYHTIVRSNNTDIRQIQKPSSAIDIFNESSTTTIKPINIPFTKSEPRTISPYTPYYLRNSSLLNNTYYNPTNRNTSLIGSIFNRTLISPYANNNNQTRFNYNPETSTRRTWRPLSTFRSIERYTTASPNIEKSTTVKTTTERITTSSTTTTTVQPITSSIRPNTTPPLKPNIRLPTSETTFAGSDSHPSADFTVRPNLGQARDTEDDGRGSSISVATYAFVSLAFVTAIGVASYGARHLANRRRRMLDESDMSSSESSSMAGATLKRPHHHHPPPNSPEDATSGILPRITQGWGEKSGANLSSPTPPQQHPQWHFPRHKLRLQTVLGQGNFGQVWKAEAEDICGIPGTRLVAVKSTKSNAGERERADLLRELAIMQQLGAHPNVVTLLGCCTEQEPHLLIMEYVMYGKLLTFLRDHRTRRDFLQFSSSDDDGGEQALTARDLTHFAYCVAKGMDYLVSRGIIHRDLAARNVLVDHNKQCKIADFGMSRHARDSSGQVYEPRQKGALPIRWMAPESLVRSIFTHRSDVWSFGILMWEIVTLGSTPYPTMGAREVMRRVREGYRLERPQHCRPELFHVIASCWMSDPSRRPDFAELRVELRRLRDEGAAWPGGGHVDLQSALPPPSLEPNTAPSSAQSQPPDPGGM